MNESFMPCRGHHEHAGTCGLCGAARNPQSATTLKYNPLGRFVRHLISSKEGRAAVLEWTQQAASPSGGSMKAMCLPNTCLKCHVTAVSKWALVFHVLISFVRVTVERKNKLHYT
jgi:hypothetical protein